MSSEPNDLEVAYELFAGIKRKTLTGLKYTAMFVLALALPISLAVAFSYLTLRSPEMKYATDAERHIAFWLSAVLGLVAGLMIEVVIRDWFESAWKNAKRRARRKKNG